MLGTMCKNGVVDVCFIMQRCAVGTAVKGRGNKVVCARRRIAKSEVHIQESFFKCRGIAQFFDRGLSNAQCASVCL